ncbi:outer membrane protein assembly factor BamD [Candidatus Azobacteroides pseudotrichonymphae]|uniref:Outer membrane lipoprotein BamD-like domain-containing protein n=1 Tax=Azobacteroides pseudotrichonymphae genomovar. CFP2 TaxID=511995 RepID=B6YQD7_AZOPC|nr:outer membrane protein assembly factor BamD [Candidatus Azobacteroides pseudotrichonymphae]BAG83409.1 conserved hypothetical protein [Candidatus Azobacteroides pseudotrichonymphae genomovar. CFP2]
MNLKLTYLSFPILVLFVPWREYNKILKNTDITLKYETAKKYFDDKKYNQAIILLEGAAPLMKHTAYEKESLYLLAQSFYKKKDYASASRYFQSYYTSFPKGEYTESAHFYSAYSLYLASPSARFDQSDTYKAIQQLQDFLKYYSQSNKKEIVKYALSELQEKLALKELMAIRLYYDLGNYLLYPFPGGNYLSCIITAQNALKSYPFSKYREDFIYYIFMARYKIALQSIKKEEKDFQYCDMTNEYYSYIDEYPSGKHLREVQQLYHDMVKHHGMVNHFKY